MDEAVVDPRAALDTAHRYTKVPGSATACVVQLCPERKALLAANLGDSGFLVFKGGKTALRSSPLQHFFDCPLQFGAYPEHVDATDSADQAQLYHVPVEPGDVIIAGSDGLWDNAYEHEILKLMPQSADEVQKAARAIGKLARKHAADPNFPSPYTEEAKAQGLDWPWWMKLMNTKFQDGQLKLGELVGGKMDDITVLVAMVEEAEVEVPSPLASTDPSAVAAAGDDLTAAAATPAAAATAVVAEAVAVAADNGAAATAVAGFGLISVFWFASFISSTAAGLKDSREPAAAAAPPKPKTLGELIAERKAELESELSELQQLPATKEVKGRLAEVRQELRQFRPPGPWWKVW